VTKLNPRHGSQRHHFDLDKLAMLSRNLASGNTAVGWFSLWSNTDGSYNTAVGAGTLLFNIGDHKVRVRERKTQP
jgi:hypothetical protein